MHQEYKEIFEDLDEDQEVERAIAASREKGVNKEETSLLKELISKADIAAEQEFPHAEAAKKARGMIDEAYDVRVEAPPVLPRETRLYHKIDDDLDTWSPNKVQSALERAVKDIRNDDFAAFDLAMSLTGRHYVGGGHMDEEMHGWIENMQRVDEVFNTQPNEETGRLKGFVVFYIDVGQLPPQKATDFVEQIKERNKQLLDNLPSNVGTVFMPQRNHPSRIDYISFDGVDNKLKNLLKKRKRRRKKPSDKKD